MNWTGVKLFIIGFLLGNVVAYQNGPLSGSLIGILFFGLFCFFEKFHLAGFFWGLAWNGPWLTSEVKGYEACSLKRQTIQSVVMIKNPQDEIYLAERKKIEPESSKPFHVSFVKSSLIFQKERSFVEVLPDDSLYLESSSVPILLKEWFMALYWGDYSDLKSETKKAFSSMGLIHLLSVSGLHMSFLGWLLIFILESVFLNGCYALLWIGPKTFYWSKMSLRFLALVLLFFYLLAIGGAHPGQRAFLMFAVNLLNPYLWAHQLSFWSSVSMACVFQILLFPTGFLHGINGLSWLCYLALKAVPWAGPLGQWVWTQGLLSLFSLAFVGQWSFLSFFWNMVFTPAFLVLFLMVGISYVTGIGMDLTCSGIEVFERMLLFAYEQQRHYMPWAWSQVENHVHPWRIGALWIGAFFLVFGMSAFSKKE